MEAKADLSCLSVKELKRLLNEAGLPLPLGAIEKDDLVRLLATKLPSATAPKEAAQAKPAPPEQHAACQSPGCTFYIHSNEDAHENPRQIVIPTAIVISLSQHHEHGEVFATSGVRVDEDKMSQASQWDGARNPKKNPNQ
eukprot:1527998-Amphidinium_carterae.1